MSKPMSNPTIKRQFLYVDDVEQLIGKHRNTLRRWVGKGAFPKPIHTPGREQAWRSEDILDWVDKFSNGYFS